MPRRVAGAFFIYFPKHNCENVISNTSSVPITTKILPMASADFFDIQCHNIIFYQKCLTIIFFVL